jgi:cysteinyl-tRNA synthetase
MDITLFNTLSRSKEAFAPLKKGAVSMYTCGPTVYDTPHLGNYRTFVMNDLLRRMFEYNNYKVTHVMNVTDVDDKIISLSHGTMSELTALTTKYEKLFVFGMQSLNALPPTDLIRATEYIPAMIELVSELLANGSAYKTSDGIYLSIEKVPNYGALAHLDPKAFSKERIANDKYDKDNPRDFAVWKFTTATDGDIAWEAPFGIGRPGWHIECSAMAMKLLGPTMDIHTGGQDLMFPHHTNEIAQSEAATHAQFVRYWIHGAFMNTSDEKMSKSLGNIVKLETLADESIAPIAYRYWLMTAHYRSPVSFSLETIRAAQSALIRLMASVASFPNGGSVSAEYQKKFNAYVNDDLDMPKAIALAWDLLKDSAVMPADKRATLLDFDRVFGLGLDKAPQVADDQPIPVEVQALTDAREEARKAKDWKKADALRAEIDARGYEVDDTPEGPRIISK